MRKLKHLTLNVYEDPSHGWIKIKTSILHRLGIAKEISYFSYQRGEYTYLEEDCDASKLIETLKENNISYTFQSHHTNRRSKIRNYSGYLFSEEK
jgi:hypothetical protein